MGKVSVDVTASFCVRQSYNGNTAATAATHSPVLPARPLGHHFYVRLIYREVVVV